MEHKQITRAKLVVEKTLEVQPSANEAEIVGGSSGVLEISLVNTQELVGRTSGKQFAQTRTTTEQSLMGPCYIQV